ncbi:MAG: DUF4430 domain-containing protein [Promethearchaeota archaeon]
MRKTAFLVLVFVLFGCSGNSNIPSMEEEPNISILVECPDGNVSETLKLNALESPISLLEAMEIMGFSVEVEEHPVYGNRVVGINGVREIPEQNLYWFFYIDGDFSSVGVDGILLDKANNIQQIKWILKQAG